MSPLTLKAAAVQMAPLFLDTQGTLGKILQYIEEGAGQGLELLVFPETILPGYPYWSMTHDPMLNLGRFNQRLHAEAVVVPGFESKALCAAAKKTSLQSCRWYQRKRRRHNLQLTTDHQQ